MNNELKPCPFCGSGQIAKMSGIEHKKHRICCCGCHASTRDFMHKTKAIAAWNKRVTEEK